MRQTASRALLPLAIAAFGAIWCLHTGRLGLFPLDQSIAFDGAYRVASGQVPIRDFLAPYGIAMYWLHGAVFWLFGVSYAVYVAGAAAVNAAAVLLVFDILRRLFADSLLPAACGAALTAIWFYPQYGTPSGEHTAFLFCLVALWLVMAALDSEGVRRRSLCAGAGIALVLAFLGKQNAALLFAPLVPAVAVAGGARSWSGAIRDLTWLAVGAAAAISATLVWLAANGVLGDFLHHYLEVPAALGRERLAKILYRPYETLIRVPRPMAMRVVLWAAVVAGLVGTVTAWWARAEPAQRRQRHLAAIVIAAGALVIQNAFITLTLNHPTGGFGLSGLIVAIGVGLLGCGIAAITRSHGRRLVVRAITPALMVAATVVLAVEGLSASHERRMHDIFQDASFEAPVDVANLRFLRWAEPTEIKGERVSAEDLARLCGYLEQRGRFFVFPEFTLLYGALGVPSPQPLLWFHPGLTYPRGGDSALDRRIVQALDANGVDTVVIERGSWFGTQAILEDFPRMRHWLESQFGPVASIGMFELYERQGVQSVAR